MHVQLCLRWSFERGYVTIGKTIKPARIVENADALSKALDGSILVEMDSLEQGFRASTACNAMEEDALTWM